MNKPKLTLEELRNMNDITVLDEEELKHAKGGHIECFIEYIVCEVTGNYGCGADLDDCLL